MLTDIVADVEGQTSEDMGVVGAWARYASGHHIAIAYPGSYSSTVILRIKAALISGTRGFT